ncbi:MAG: 4Fe-4S dicluster domain-containing protein [Desulfovibrio sp.]|nr:4Fe-4S dicluster domain-containing protein [Desulfovibrio sp.]
MSQEKKKKRFSVQVESKLCKACLYCVASCNKGVFEQGKALNPQGYEYVTAVHSGECVGCLTCIGICPDFAVTVSELPD